MHKRKIKLGFHGGTGEVTGANFLLETEIGGKTFRALIDCGMYQGPGVLPEKNNEPFPYDPKSIDILFVTHPHMDHIGRVPKLVKDGFRGRIISTQPTEDLAELMFDDALNVYRYHVKKAKKYGEKIPEPMYEEKDVAQTMELWESIPYGKNINLGDDFIAEFQIAGHTLGSGMVVFSNEGRRLVFTGDLGNAPTPLLRDPKPVPGANFMVMESVYGDRNHENRDERRNILKETIKEIDRRKAVLMIPTFSLERTQEIVYEIERMMEEKEIPSVPVYIDSPLAIKITEVYKKHSSFFRESVREQIEGGNQTFKFPDLHVTESVDESKAIKEASSPKIIIAGSGMSNGGRIVHHQRNYLPDSNNILLLVGYQAIGTPGRMLQEGVKKIRIFQDDIPVRAEVRTLNGYSGHMDSEHLLEFVSHHEGLERVFVVMGETESALFLTQRLRDYLEIKAEAPEPGSEVEIEL